MLDELRQLLKETVKEALREELKPAQTEAFPELLSRSEAARFAKVSTATIDSWVKSGRLRRYGAGRSVRLRKDELLSPAPEQESKLSDDDAREWARKALRGRK